MGRIKAFLKKDSDILRNTILLLFGLIFGISKLIYDHRVSAIFIGLFCVLVSIFTFIDIIKEFKRTNSVNVETTKVEEDVKGKRLKKIILIVISLLFTWIFGLYFLFYKNDEAMVVMIPIFSYLILRDSFKKRT
ncbi:hypothetical protein SAMN05444673_2837 [Bacillus sp. OV166]|uniref:hypothetical protein n=1 Tax=Bacillus sp. OV166 TaxID=1882763 RepID=UPI000A2AD25F|nr:hypothetical protein [Bacillus sp. OV166]SMQ77508.1 hypothetical protein SAMN05444673_2837 [Bacillus sp. OV166]